MKYLMKNNILAQQHYIPLYKFKVFNGNDKNFPDSEKYFKNSVSIPIFVSLNNKNQNKVIKTIQNYF